MWDTPFEISMLENSDIVINCPDKADAESLMAILADCGVKWNTGESLLTTDNYWGEEEENTVYYISNRIMTYGNIARANGNNRYVKCTFCSVEPPNFDAAFDDDIRSLLGI